MGSREGRPISLQIDDGGFRYGPQAQGLLVSSWTERFQGGEVTAMTGPSGCGKSTRLYLLGLLLRLTAGRVLIDGDRVDDLADAARSRLRAERFGFVFQDAALDATRTVLDNVTESALYSGLDANVAQTRAHQLLEQFDVRLPTNRRPGQVSGGQAQRIALCRALLNDPDVVLADEPTGNLDDASAEVVLDGLRAQAASGAVVIVVTHDQRVAAWSDRRLAVDAGR